MSIFQGLQIFDSLQEIALRIPIYVFRTDTTEPRMVPCFAKISSSRAEVYLYMIDLQSSGTEKSYPFMTIPKSAPNFTYAWGCSGSTACIQFQNY